MIRKHVDGGMLYTVESKMLLDLLGQKEEVSTSEAFHVTDDLKSVSIRTTIRQLSEAVNKVACAIGNGFLLIGLCCVPASPTRADDTGQGSFALGPIVAIVCQ